MSKADTTQARPKRKRAKKQPVKKMKSGYQIRWVDADGQEHWQTFKGIDYREALRLKRERWAARDRGEVVPNPRAVPTVKTFAERWLEEGRGGWKWGTQQQYGSAVRAWIVPRLGDRRVSTLTQSDVKQLITAMRDQSRSPGYVNVVVTVLRLISEAAIATGYLPRDPTAGVRPLPREATDVCPLTPDEVETFLTTCPGWWRPYFILAVLTGARPCELTALKWSDVDLERGTMRIRRARYRGHEDTPKTPKSIREVELVPGAVAALKQQREQQAARRRRLRLATLPEGDYVFMGRNGACAEASELRRRVWWPTLERAGLAERTMYQLRHTFASNAIEAGASLLWVAKQLGHGSLKMISETYAKWMPNTQDGAKFAARMAGARRLRVVSSTAPRR